MPAHIEIDERPGVWVLEARGELDYADCGALRHSIERILSDMPRGCVVDLSQIDYLDSSGLGLLLRLNREYAGSGGRLVLIASSVVEGILRITRLDELFTTAADLGAALAHVAADEDPAPAG